MTAFVFGVIGWLATPHPHCGLDCYVSAKTGPFDYLYNNWFLYINQNQIAGTPNGIPAYLIWNQSLWTLYYEFLCYLGLGLLALAGFLRHRIITFIATAGLWLTVTIITLTPTLNAQFNPFQNWTAMNLLKFATVFLVGSVIYLYRDQIPDSAWLALVCTALFAASLFLPREGRSRTSNSRRRFFWLRSSPTPCSGWALTFRFKRSVPATITPTASTSMRGRFRRYWLYGE